MNRVSLRSQRGTALIALLAVIALGASWYMVRRLNADSGLMTAVMRERNAEVLNRAKQALIGYVANDAADSAENNPGRLPCPEAPGYFDNPSTEGTAAGTCTLPAVGRFPWRTLGLDKLVDASGEPLWYVVSPGWAYSGSNLTINSNTLGQLTVDGVANDSVALIIAPGPAFAVQAASGCGAKSQVRPTSGTPDPANYLECQNAVGTTFVTTGPTGSFNDQLVRVTAADVLPGIEAAIADRIQRQIVPILQTVYTGASWGLGVSRKYPFAAVFANPSTSAMQGALATYQGLLPMTHAETFPGSGVLCTAGSDPRCAPTFVNWSSASMSGGSTYSETCTHSASQINCSYYYAVCIIPLFCGTTTSVPFTVTATAANVGMALRQLNGSTAGMTNVLSASVSAVLNANGSATATIAGTASVSSSGTGLVSNLICGLSGFMGIIYGCKPSTLSIPITVFADHSLLDSRTPPTGPAASWFVRNDWQELTYYALAPGYAPSGSASCTTGSTCLTVTNVTPSGAQRSILVLAGRSINGDLRPSASLADYLEFGNVSGSFESHAVTSSMSSPYADVGSANAYSIGANVVPAGRPLQFQAANANTGPSTLTTPATGALTLLNADGSNLTAGEIQAEAAVEVVYNGTNFILSKRPYNDRVVVVDSN